MKKFIILLFFLCYGCGCFEYTHVGFDDYSDHPDIAKKFTIVNRTDKTYTNNALHFSARVQKRKGTWKLYPADEYYGYIRKINSIGGQKTVNNMK